MDSHRAHRIVTRLALWRLLVMVLLVVSVWLVSYKAQSDLYRAGVHACERLGEDRHANALAWQAGADVLTKAIKNPTLFPAQRETYRVSRRVYQRAANRFNQARESCLEELPRAKLLLFF